MIKALLLIFEPSATWDRITRTPRGITAVFFLFLLPLLAITSAGEAYGLTHWGKWQPVVGHTKVFSIQEAAAYEAAQFLLTLLLVVIGANFVKSLSDTFHGRHSFAQAFATVAYGLSPLFLLRLLDSAPGISPWVAWAIGIILSISVLYHGVPRMMEPDPSHAFGLYLMSVLLLFVSSGLARFVTAWYLEGRFTKLQGLFPS